MSLPPPTKNYMSGFMRSNKAFSVPLLQLSSWIIIAQKPLSKYTTCFYSHQLQTEMRVQVISVKTSSFSRFRISFISQMRKLRLAQVDVKAVLKHNISVFTIIEFENVFCVLELKPFDNTQSHCGSYTHVIWYFSIFIVILLFPFHFVACFRHFSEYLLFHGRKVKVQRKNLSSCKSISCSASR